MADTAENSSKRSPSMAKKRGATVRPAVNLMVAGKSYNKDFMRFIPLVIIMFRKKDGGDPAVAKKRPATGTFF
jgi:hypothetical protein